MENNMIPFIDINNRRIGSGYPVYIIAEMSANHNHNFEEAVQIIKAAKEAGADAIKLQTYTADTMTIDCNKEHFLVGEGTIWKGKRLYELYGEAYTPWEWQPRLKKIAEESGIELFSTPFDHSAVDFLEKMDVEVYKVASFEIVDLPLLQKIARTGKPIIISTGLANFDEIDEAVQTIRNAGNDQIALLKCNSAYPASADEMNLRTIPHLEKSFEVPVGISDHTLGIAVPVAAVPLGACIVEKHFTLTRDVPGPDSAFSLNPSEFKEMVESIRIAEQALGSISFEVTEKEKASHVFRRSLFVVKDVKAGDAFTEENLRSIRPGYGMHTRHLKEILGKRASRDIEMGTPLSHDLVKEI